MSNLKMKDAALIYLDRSGGLQKFIDDCKYYNDSKQSYAVYRFNILINPSDVLELDAELGNHILHHPLKAVQVFQSVCFIAVKTLSLIGHLQTETQINIVLKLTHLPPLPSYVLDLCEFPLDYSSQRFYMMQGIVIAMTTITKYTQGARFLCSEEACPLSKGFQYIRVHVPGATESATVRNDFLCDLCSSSLQEDRKFRVLGDKQIVEIITTKALHAFQGYSKNQAFRFQSFTVFLRDELVNKMNIGNEYKIIGILACVKSSQTTVCIEANSIVLCNPKVSSGISDNFNCLLSLTSSSRWKFTAMLANIFASQIVPPGSYNLLKLCLLMSLVQTNDSKKELENCLDILIMTSDTLFVERLLNFSISLVSRGIHHPVSTEIFPNLSRNKYGTGAVSIQAGSALLAKGGICFIGDLCSHKKDKLEQLQSGELTKEKNIGLSDTKEVAHTTEEKPPHCLQLLVGCQPGGKVNVIISLLMENCVRTWRIGCSWKQEEERCFLSGSPESIVGATAFGVAPNAVFPFELYNEEYLEQRDLYLTQCQQQLQQFIATYGPGTSVFSSDE
ncbi:hypothetical protein H920_18299 [Fukomys damarensis]|uniref:MCMDC2 N-terminal domain-containing protein n=1 Tax=Fukomys damarensis TaxID=885580 RepID=A0A091CQD5_FUKDA|nr:hypothetical protein H920_18299 [Fukomys damarensis]